MGILRGREKKEGWRHGERNRVREGQEGDWEKEKGGREKRTEIYLRMDKDLENGGGG